MTSGWNLSAWLQCIGVASRCCCKEVYRYPHNNCERSAPVTRVGWRISLLYNYIYIFVSMGTFGPAWALRNAQRANVGLTG